MPEEALHLYPGRWIWRFLMVATFVAIVFLGYFSYIASQRQSQAACIAKLNSQGWAALGKLADAPVGDQAARDKATTLFVQTAKKMDDVRKYCP